MADGTPKIFLTLLVGCVLAWFPAAGAELKAVSDEDMPADIVIVTSAMVLEMRDLPPPGDATKVVFENGSDQSLKEPNFSYEGFRLARTMLGHFKRGEDNTASVSGIFDFVDNYERRVLAAFEAEYEIGTYAIYVTKARSAPYFRSRPDVRVFVVPATAITADAVVNFTNNATLLAFVAQHAVLLDGTGGSQGAAQDYLVFAFVMDRLAPDDTVEIRLENLPDDQAARKKDTLVLDHVGWRVAIAEARFDIGGNVEFRVIYTPGVHAPEKDRRPTPIGVFTTRRPPQG